MNEEIEACQFEVRECNRRIGILVDERRKHQVAIERLEAAERLERQDTLVLVLAARHLTPGEGPVTEGHVVTKSDMLALSRVIDFVSSYVQAHS